MPLLRLRLLSALALLAACPAALPAATIRVPGDQPTVQAGIDAAAAGDTVLVAPGTYFENLDFRGKGITVTSAAGPAVTTIDGSSSGPAVTFRSSEPRSAVLSGFTLQHGSLAPNAVTNANLAGIYIQSGQPTIRNNVITHNLCFDIQSSQAAPLIQGNTISATESPDYGCGFASGAGIYIDGNLQGDSPGATNGSAPVMLGKTVEKKIRSGLSDAGGNGGAAIAVWGGSPLILNNILRNNSSPGGVGGAINIVYGTATVVQNLIYGNQAGCGGGALAFLDGYVGPGVTLLISNNTIVNNNGQGNAGDSNCNAVSQIFPGLYGDSGPTAVFVNNIISGSTSEPAVQCSVFGGRSEAIQPLFDHNLLYNAAGPFFDPKYCVDVSGKYGNIAADPQFVDPAHGDFHLRPTSPAIDHGNNSALALLEGFSATPLPTDFDGNPRLGDATAKGSPTIDMGAYETPGLADAAATTLVLQSSAYTGPAGNSNTLTATAASALGTPTGPVAFSLDGQPAGTALLDASGVATLGNVAFTPGVHNLRATYAGQGGFPPATSVVLIIRIDLYGTGLTLRSSPNPSLVGQPVTFTVTVTSPDPAFHPSPVTLVDSSTNTTLATLTPDAAGHASVTTSALALGYHVLTADVPGDSAHYGGHDVLSQQVVDGLPTTARLTSSPNPAGVGQTVTFTANVAASDGGTLTGTVTFADGAATLATQPLTSGVASTTTAALGRGAHTITATYNPGGSYAGSSATLQQSITGLPTTASLTATSPSVYAGGSITLTATIVAADTSQGVPTGTVTFYEGATRLAPPAVPLASGAASLNIPASAGTHTFTAVYSGDSVHESSTAAPATLTLLGNPTALTLAASPNPARSFAPVTLAAHISSSTSTVPPAGGRITFFSNGSPLGTVTVAPDGTATLVTALPAGTDTFTASSAADTLFAAAVSPPVTETVVADGTAAVLTVSPNPAVQHSAVTLTAQVSAGSSTAIPAGAVTFFDGTALLATAPLDSAGRATLTSRGLTVGTHTVSAVYGGSRDHLASSSAAVTLTISPQDFALAAEPAITLRTEHHGDLGLQLSSIGSFADTVALRCEGLPAFASCRFRDAAPALTADASLTSSVHIDTDFIPDYKAGLRRPWAEHHGTLLAALLLPLTFVASRRRRALLRRVSALSLALVAAALLPLAGCSGRSPGHTSPVMVKV